MTALRTLLVTVGNTVFYWSCFLMHSLDSEQAAKMNTNCCVMFKVGTSKADPTGSHWAPFPVYLPFRWGEPINAAKAIMELDQIM